MPATAPRKPNRTRLAPEERRRQLVRVAGQLLTKRGLVALSFTALASRARVTRPVVYRFFPTRRALVIAVLEDFQEELSRRFLLAATRELPGVIAARVRQPPIPAITRVFIEAVCDTIDDRGAGPWHLLDAKGPDAAIARRGAEILEGVIAPWRSGIATRTGATAAEVETLSSMLVAAGRAVLERWYGGAISREEAVRDATRGVTALLRAFTRAGGGRGLPSRRPPHLRRADQG